MRKKKLMLKLADREGKKGITLDLKVTPGAKEDAFAGVQGDRLRVKIAAKAVEGAANVALLKFIAESFAVPSSCVQLLAGRTGRLKTVFIYTSARGNLNPETGQKQLWAIAEKLSNADPNF